jgi:hypothetical protein
LYLKNFAHAGKLYKNIKNQLTRSNWSKEGHHGPLGGVARPHHASADVETPVPPHQSMGLAKKHTLNSSPSLISSRFKMKGWKWVSHGLLTHHAYVGAQMDKVASYPNSTTPLGPPHRRRRAHSIVRRHPTSRGITRRPTFTPSPLLQTHARKHTQVGFIGGWSKGCKRLSHGSLMWR